MAFLTEAANRGSVSTGPYQIDNSLKFERSSNEAVETTNQAGGNRKTWTFSAWIKRTALSEDYHTIFGAEYTNIQIMANDRPRLVLYNGTSYYADPEMLMRDTSAWYHIVVQLDTTQSTAADRVKWWINGERVTTFNNSTYTNMTQNTDFSGVGQPSSYGSGGWLRLGRFFSGDEGFDGYMADVYYLNGTAAEADDFGEYDEDSGIWVPKAYTGGGYGTQGFHYKFNNASNLGEDSSGEGHDANSLSNITSADQATDTPTNNFATFNTLYDYDGVVINEGATKTTNENTANFRSVVSNIAVQNGKWYAEFTAGSISAFVGVGLVEEMTGSLPKTQYLGQLGESISYYAYQGQILHGGSAQSTTGTFAGYGAGDVIGIALDKTNGFVYWHKNGTYQNSGDPTSGATGTGGIALSLGYSGYAQSDYYFMGYAQSSATAAYANFGGYTADTPSSAASDANGYGTFEYAPPTGYYALCTKNLAEFG